jgi:Response regulators consisting of a CheY-like receiver domain and a winged-helix DNA-binding domain
VTPSSQHNHEEVRTEANFILKVVDQCIKAGLLEEAKGHLDKARIIDPTNAYIYAFQERIAFLKEETAKKNVAVSNRGAMEDAARARLDEDRRRAELERLKKEADQQKQREEWQQKKLEAEKRHENESLSAVAHPIQEPATSPKSSDKTYSVPMEMQPKIETIVPAQKPAQAPMQQNTTAPVQRRAQETIPHVAQTQKTTDQARDMYKRVLLLAWADGAVSPEEQSQLRDLRTTLRITTEEHTKLELEAKEESYAHAFTLVWTSGMNAKERSAVINELRYKYQISPEAHSRIESKVLVEFGEHQDKPMLYVIDDDENTLGMIVRVLEGGGFTVQAYNTSDEALTGLKNDMPSLIISDINLETSTIGGFSFYEKVRQLHHLSLVPFIFLSGMTDEGMVRYGKGLGADDYLTKPFSGDMLVDTVKGKLKRYKQMKHN